MADVLKVVEDVLSTLEPLNLVVTFRDRAVAEIQKPGQEPDQAKQLLDELRTPADHFSSETDSLRRAKDRLDAAKKAVQASQQALDDAKKQLDEEIESVLNDVRGLPDKICQIDELQKRQITALSQKREFERSDIVATLKATQDAFVRPIQLMRGIVDQLVKGTAPSMATSSTLTQIGGLEGGQVRGQNATQPSLPRLLAANRTTGLSTEPQGMRFFRRGEYRYTKEISEDGSLSLVGHLPDNLAGDIIAGALKEAASRRTHGRGQLTEPQRPSGSGIYVGKITGENIHLRIVAVDSQPVIKDLHLGPGSDQIVAEVPDMNVQREVTEFLGQVGRQEYDLFAWKPECFKNITLPKDHAAMICSSLPIIIDCVDAKAGSRLCVLKTTAEGVRKMLYSVPADKSAGKLELNPRCWVIRQKGSMLGRLLSDVEES